MRRPVIALLLALSFVATACASDDGGARAAGGGAGGSGEAADFEAEVTVGDDGRLVPGECAGDNVASEDDGVTEDSVHVSVLSIDFERLAAIGFAASDRDPTAIFATFVDEVNDEGGVCGREIDLQQVTYDIVQAEGGQACVEATEDRTNLVVSTAAYAEVLCLTDAGVPVYAGIDATAAEMDDSNGLLFTRYPRLEDQYRATVQHALDTGALDGPVGVWYGSVYPDQTDAVEDVVLPMLDDAGVDYTEFRTDTVGPTDPEGNAALSAAATEFAARDVETVLAFVQNAHHTGIQTELDAQGLRPRWISMPIAANSVNEIFADRFGTREIADGQEFVTFTAGSAELDGDDPIAAACHEIFTRRTGEEVEPGTFDYASVVTTCVQVDILAAALSLAGGDLTRDRFVQALEALPAHRVPPVLGEVAWSPGNHFGPTTFSVQDYDGGENRVTTSEETFEIDG